MIIDARAHACGEFADQRKLTEILDKLEVDKVAFCPGLKGLTDAPPLPNIPIASIKPKTKAAIIHPFDNILPPPPNE